MPIFKRRQLAPVVKGGYAQFSQFVREDFSECCAYCLLYELLAAGAENFELDHFRPQSIFPALSNDFFNLYYACHRCNHKKRNVWPAPDNEASGYRFVDPCRELFSIHFQELENGRWVPLTKAAEFTEYVLQLNTTHLVNLRAVLRAIAYARGLEPVNWDEPSKGWLMQLLRPLRGHQDGSA